jgi:hypothetical protein
MHKKLPWYDFQHNVHLEEFLITIFELFQLLAQMYEYRYLAFLINVQCRGFVHLLNLRIRLPNKGYLLKNYIFK